MCGALLLLVADYILYLPSRYDENASQFYFQRIDPSAGEGLKESSMSKIGEGRLLLGGLLAAPACVLYSLGFLANQVQ